MTDHLKRKLNALLTGGALWLFPIIALLICGWLLFQYFQSRGPEIEISFEDASGIQTEKTQIRYRGVAIGTVHEISISEDKSHVVIKALLQSNAKHFAVEGSKFWVVKPKVDMQGVSGLETLIEGSYIAVHPGSEKAALQTNFKGQTTSEFKESAEDTVTYFLETSQADSVSVGDNVTFRGLSIGNVAKVQLNKTAQSVLVQFNIQNKYTRLIRTNSVFWRKVAIQAKLGLFNSELKVNSLDSMLRGGVEVFTPDNVGPIANAQTQFRLEGSPPKDWEKWNPKLEF